MPSHTLLFCTILNSFPQSSQRLEDNRLNNGFHRSLVSAGVPLPSQSSLLGESEALKIPSHTFSFVPF